MSAAKIFWILSILCVIPSFSEKVTFLRNGKLHNVRHILRIKLQFPIAPYLKNCAKWNEILQDKHDDHNYNKTCVNRMLPFLGCSTMSEKDMLPLRLLIEQSNATVQAACVTLRSLPGVATLDSEKTRTVSESHQAQSGDALVRTERQAVLYTAVFSLGTLMGEFASKLLGLGQTDHVLEIAESNRERINHLETQMEKIKSLVGIDVWHTEILQLSVATENFARLVQELAQGITQLYSERLPLHLLYGINFDMLFLDLQSKAGSLGGHLPFTSLDQLFQFPAKFHPDATNQMLHVSVDIPVINDEFDVFYLKDKSIISGDHSEMTFLKVNHEKHFIVVSKDSNRFAELSDNELSACVLMGDHYFCHLGFMQSNYSESCLAGLYKGDFRTVAQLCNLHVLQTNWHLNVQPQLVTIYSKKSMVIREYCAENSTASTVQGITHISRRQNCSIISDNFAIPNPPETEVFATLVVDVLWDLKVLGPSFSFAEIQRMQDELQSQGVTPEQHIHKLRIQYAQHVKHQTEMRNLTVAVICVLVLCVLVCCLFGYVFRIAWRNSSFMP